MRVFLTFAVSVLHAAEPPIEDAPEEFSLMEESAYQFVRPQTLGRQHATLANKLQPKPILKTPAKPRGALVSMLTKKEKKKKKTVSFGEDVIDIVTPFSKEVYYTTKEQIEIERRSNPRVEYEEEQQRIKKEAQNQKDNEAHQQWVDSHD